MINKQVYLQSLILISEALTVNKDLLRDLNHLYQLDKIKYYKKASSHALYNDSQVTNGTIEHEINIKKVFGIVLCAEEDEKLRAIISKLLKKYYPEFYFPIKKRSDDLFKAIEHKPNANPDWILKNSYSRIPYYIVRLIFGFEHDFSSEYSRFFDDTEQKALQNIDFVPVYNADKYKDDLEKTEWLHNAEKEFIFFQRCKDFSAFMDYRDDVGSSTLRYASISSEMQNAILNNLRFVVNLLDHQNISNSALTNPITLTKKEINDIFITLLGVYRKNVEYKSLSNEQLALYYVFGIYFQSIIKEYKNARDVFRANNQETQFLEIEKLLQEKEALKREIDNGNQTIEQLKSRINDVERKAARERTDLEKSLYDEIKTLKTTNEKNKKAVDEQRLQLEEIYRLREFAFALEADDSSEKSPDEKFEIPANTKIFLVGGHENWRKKVKERFPTISIVDGTNKNLDVAIFSKADLVLFFTPHMSHATYEKVIGYLNKNKLKYGYVSEINLNKFQNQLQRILISK